MKFMICAATGLVLSGILTVHLDLNIVLAALVGGSVGLISGTVGLIWEDS